MRTYEPKLDYKVLCHCITYNQAQYIEQTMNSFAMQKTSFPFVCYIMDDASTDGEQDVIKAYLENHFDMKSAEFVEIESANIIIARHTENVYCTFAVFLLKRNLWKEPQIKEKLYTPWYNRSKYIALCEGDDYWIDPVKLQKQIDFLDSHPDFSMCFHNAFVFFEDYSNQPYLSHKIKDSREIEISEIINNWIIPTASIVYKSSMLPFPDWTNKIYSGDQTLALMSFAYGKVYAFRDVMSVYRRNSVSSISNSIRQTQHMNFVALEHLKLYNYYNEYTQGKFREFVEPHIEYLKEKASFYEDREKSLILALIKHPQFAFGQLMHKF